MKKGLLGCVNNITQNLDKIKVWAKSFGEVCNGEVHLVCINPMMNEVEILRTMGIGVSLHMLETNETVNNSRLKLQIEALEKLDWDYGLVTDVFDVMFQDDPFIDIIDTEILVGIEGVLHSEEPWNLDVMQKSYPDKVELVRNQPIVCSGVIGGKKDKLITLLKGMDIITMGGEKGHDIRDQAALNIIVYEPKPFEMMISTPSNSFVLHCAVGGPTQFYEGWGFKRIMQERFGEAEMVDGVVINGKGEIFKIVHQFNRIEEWNKLLTQRYI